MSNKEISDIFLSFNRLSAIVSQQTRQTITQTQKVVAEKKVQPISLPLGQLTLQPLIKTGTKKEKPIKHGTEYIKEIAILEQTENPNLYLLRKETYSLINKQIALLSWDYLIRKNFNPLLGRNFIANNKFEKFLSEQILDGSLEDYLISGLKDVIANPYEYGGLAYLLSESEQSKIRTSSFEKEKQEAIISVACYLKKELQTEDNEKKYYKIKQKIKEGVDIVNGSRKSNKNLATVMRADYIDSTMLEEVDTGNLRLKPTYDPENH